MFARNRLLRLVCLSSMPLGLFASSRHQSEAQPNGKTALIDIIPPVKSVVKGNYLHEQTFVSWIEECSHDYQKLSYGPIDFLTTIAFLRLLGAEEISLKQLSYNALTRKTYINQLPKLPKKIIPVLIDEVPQAFLAIKECQYSINTDAKLRSTKIGNATVHMLPSLVCQTTLEFEKGALSKLYSMISSLSDDEIDDFVSKFIPNDSPEMQSDLSQRLIMARKTCIKYSSDHLCSNYISKP